MIKLTAPIELNIKTSFVRAGEGFAERINANYGMITSETTPGEMLHVTSEPPQFYFGGDQNSSYNSTSNINLKENITTNIVNNLINRIMVEPSFGVTYQDRIYISNALRKLGVKNENSFMKQVYAMKDEISQTNRLINMYFSYGEEIKELVNEYMSEETRVSSESSSYSDQNLHLHEDILNRLKSALIYSTVNNYQENAYGMDVISTNEMMIAEQRRTYENILLKELQNDARNERLPLIYRAENYYEEYDFNEEEVTDKSIGDVINQATLLNYITNAVETKSTSENNNINIWYEIRPDIQSTSQNTLLRMESHIKNEGSSRIFNRINRETRNLIMNNEINLISSLMEDNRRVDILNEAELNFKTEESLSLSEELYRMEENLQIENQKNLENRINYENQIKNELSKVQKIITKEQRDKRQRQDSIRALEFPEEIIQNLRIEQALSDENARIIEERAAMENLNDDDRVVDMIQMYLKNPSQGVPGAIITEGDFGALASDIAMVERNQRQRELIESERAETIEKVSKEVARELSGDIKESVLRQEDRESINSLRLTHRSENSFDFEEVTEQLMEQNRWLYENTTKNENKTTDQNIQRNTVVNENITETKTRNLDIERTVENTVNRQFNILSDQIYRKIESKLEMEKRRRGL